MKINYFLMGLLMFLFSIGAQAAGSPMNEDFSNLITLSTNAIEVGKTGDTQAFINSVNVARTALKAQADEGSSIRLQRANAKLIKAIKAAKKGDFDTGIAALEASIKVMELVR